MASPNDLQFQEFEEAAELLSADPGASTLSTSASNTITPAAAGGGEGEDVKLDLSEDEEGQEESSELLGGQKPTGGFWTFEYYQSFFNVDTVQVLDRVKGSVMPLPGSNFIKHHLRSNPDLYGCSCCSSSKLELHVESAEIPGVDKKYEWAAWAACVFFSKFRKPVEVVESTDNMEKVIVFFSQKHTTMGPFWICVTLVFSVVISGNLSTFLSEMGNPSYHYRPQFHRVTIAAVVIFMYAWLVPIALWGFLTWRQGAERQIGGYTFLETVCVYGYSLFIYIPTSVLWIIPFEWLRWTLILFAMVISGSVLVLTFWPAVRDDTKVMSVATVVTIVVLHTLLAIGCKMYFFHIEVHVPTTAPTPPPLHITVATTLH